MTAFWRRKAKTIVIVLCTEAKVKARMEELASEGRASAEGVNRPFHFRVKLLFRAKKEVKGADAMDGERFFELFGEENVTQENLALPLHVPTLQAVEATFADGNDLRLPCNVRHYFPQFVYCFCILGCPPRMYAHGIQGTFPKMECLGM